MLKIFQSDPILNSVRSWIRTRQCIKFDQKVLKIARCRLNKRNQDGRMDGQG